MHVTPLSSETAGTWLCWHNASLCHLHPLILGGIYPRSMLRRVGSLKILSRISSNISDTLRSEFSLWELPSEFHLHFYTFWKAKSSLKWFRSHSSLAFKTTTYFVRFLLYKYTVCFGGGWRILSKTITFHLHVKCGFESVHVFKEKHDSKTLF